MQPCTVLWGGHVCLPELTRSIDSLQILFFVGAYRLLHDNNHLAVFAVHENAWCASAWGSSGNQMLVDCWQPFHN